MYSPKSDHYIAAPTYSTYILRCLVVVTMIIAAATFLHINNYRPSKLKQKYLANINEQDVYRVSLYNLKRYDFSFISRQSRAGLNKR